MRILRNSSGSAIVEFGLTLPIFFAFIIGIATAGLGLYAQLSLQHGVEMAARCASINKLVCGTVSQIQDYAVQHSYGLNPAPSTFSVSAPSCGEKVQATYGVTLNFAVFGAQDIMLTASSCFPK